MDEYYIYISGFVHQAMLSAEYIKFGVVELCLLFVSMFMYIEYVFPIPASKTDNLFDWFHDW